MRIFYSLILVCAMALPAAAQRLDSLAAKTFTKAVDLISSDTAKHKYISYFITPIFGFTPETGFIFGVSPMFVFTPRDVGGRHFRSSNLDFNIDISTKRQLLFDGIYNVFLFKEKVYWRGVTAVSRFSYDYYGIGPRTSANERAVFGYDMFSTDNIVQYNLVRKWYLGPGWRYESMQRMRYYNDSLLLQTKPRGWDGSIISGPKVGLTFDDRDNILTASKGWFFDVNLESFFQATGSDFNFTELDFDLRHYIRISHTADQILALQGLAQFTFGEAPFKDLNLLGGPNMLRGYYLGRFRDNQYVAAQAEYRRHIWRWFGMAAFFGAGQVANSVDRFEVYGLKYAGGVGLRLKVLPRENVNARWDIAVNREGQFNFYLVIAEAF